MSTCARDRRSCTHQPTASFRSPRMKKSSRSTNSIGFARSRAKYCSGKHEVGRVIARPFVGTSGAYTRTANRHDYAVPPPQGMLLDQLHDRGIPVHSVGKISDVFLGRGITASDKTKSNADGMAKTLAAMNRLARRSHLRQPRRFRSELRPPQRCRGLRESSGRSGRMAPEPAQRERARRPHHSHGRSRLRSDDTEHRSQPRVRASARLRWQTERRSWHAFDTL